VLWSKSPVSAWLECVVVNIASFSMAERYVLWSKMLVSAWLECVVVEIANFSNTLQLVNITVPTKINPPKKRQ
jgi:hypothetical protein